MKKYKQIIFDFDGTLCNSEEGIIKCIEYAMEKLGEPQLPLDTMRRFIGPALFLSFRDTAGLSEARAEEAVAYYRERYIPIGIYECHLFDGIAELLQTLHERGVTLAVASAKPHNSVIRACANLNIDKYFTKIVGAPPDVKSNEKDGYVRSATLDSPALMVGDAPYDIEAGKRTNTDTFAVTYGFFPREQLVSLNPDYTADSVAHLREKLLTLI